MVGEKMQDSKIKKGAAVMVTTDQKGVFFGYYFSRSGTEVKLKDVRNCLYWPESQRGFLGLAKYGPAEGSRVGPAAEEVLLLGVTSICFVGKEAERRWLRAPWGQ